MPNETESRHNGLSRQFLKELRTDDDVCSRYWLEKDTPHNVDLSRTIAFDTTICTNVLPEHTPAADPLIIFLLENIRSFPQYRFFDTITQRFTMKMFVQYFLIAALIVGSAKAQCKLADTCDECLNDAIPKDGDSCTVSYTKLYHGIVLQVNK